MNKRNRIAASLLCATLLALAGCETGKQKKEAYQHWNATRAGIQASLATERYKLGNMEDARKAIDEAIKLDPQNAGYHIISARIFIEGNQLELADRELQLSRKLDPKNGEVDYLSGLIYQRWQKTNLALEHYSNACEKAPGELPYLMARAEMLVLVGRLDDAVQAIESKLTYFEYSGPLRDQLGGLYLQQNKIPQAIETIHQATILSPDDLTIREHLARAEFRGAKYRESLADLETLLKSDEYKDRADLYMLKAECHVQLGQWREARAAIETSIDKNSSSEASQLVMVKVALKLHDLERADLSARKAVALNPDDPQAYLARGYVRLRQQKWAESMADFEKAHALDDKDPMALCMMGLVMEKTGQQDQALACYGQALQLKPNDPMARKLLSKAK